MTILRPAFDRSRTFAVCAHREVIAGERVFSALERFDKGAVSTRRLGQLYDNRTIMIVPDDYVGPSEVNALNVIQASTDDPVAMEAAAIIPEPPRRKVQHPSGPADNHTNQMKDNPVRNLRRR